MLKEEEMEEEGRKWRALGTKGVQKERAELFYRIPPPSHPLFSQMPNPGANLGSPVQ